MELLNELNVYLHYSHFLLPMLRNLSIKFIERGHLFIYATVAGGWPRCPSIHCIFRKHMRFPLSVHIYVNTCKKGGRIEK